MESKEWINKRFSKQHSL